MYRTNKKEIIDLVQQKRKEGLTQTKTAEFLNENNYLYLNKYGNLVKFRQGIISDIENTFKLNKSQLDKPSFDDKRKIIKKIEEVIKKTNVFAIPLLFCSDKKFIQKIKKVFDLDIQENKDDIKFNFYNHSFNATRCFLSRYIRKDTRFEFEFEVFKRISFSKKGTGKHFKVYAKSLEDIQEFERKIKDNKTHSNLPLFEEKKEIKEKYLKVNETKDKQLLALNLKLECDRLKSIDQYVAETEKEISNLNMRLEKLNQSILQYNKVRGLTEQQIEEINKELSNE